MLAYTVQKTYFSFCDNHLVVLYSSIDHLLTKSFVQLQKLNKSFKALKCRNRQTDGWTDEWSQERSQQPKKYYFHIFFQKSLERISLKWLPHYWPVVWTRKSVYSFNNPESSSIQNFPGSQAATAQYLPYPGCHSTRKNLRN